MRKAEKLLRSYLGIPEATPIHPTHTLSWVAALDAMNRLMENISNNNQQQKESNEAKWLKSLHNKIKNKLKLQ